MHALVTAVRGAACDCLPACLCTAAMAVGHGNRHRRALAVFLLHADCKRSSGAVRPWQLVMGTGTAELWLSFCCMRTASAAQEL